MRKPYPLSHDLYSLIFEAATEPQRWLHFPLFRHAGTRITNYKRHGGGVDRRVKDEAGVNLARPAVCIAVRQSGEAGVSELQSPTLPQLREVSTQMELFAAAA